MYLVLLVFGGILTVAGLVLATSGLSLHDHVIDMSIVTPGIVAAVGGMALVGLGLALRVLQRIENSLAARPMPRVARPGEVNVSAPAPAAAPPTEGTGIPLPPRTPPLRAAVAAAVAAPTGKNISDDLAEKASDRSGERLPGLSQIESTTIVEEMEVALSSRPPSSVDDAVSQIDKLRAARRKGGSARITPRFDLGARAPLTADRPKGPAFDALWPKGPRPTRTAQASAVQAAAAPASEVVEIREAVAPEEMSAPVPETAPETAEVSVLKSGVVDGMAYTLYSDGSIEAELPQGTLRFGSITELRSHIEQTA